MGALERLFDLPDGSAPDPAVVGEVQDQINGLLDVVESQDFPHRESRFVAGAVAVSARRCLQAFTTAYERSGRDATEGAVRTGSGLRRWRGG